MSKTKIFYVEDELFLGKIVRESLESRGFEVTMEGDGGKAVESFKKSKPISVYWISCCPIKTALLLRMK
jgi:DNA-binding response OmpR family regulator